MGRFYGKMVKYAREPENAAKSCKAKGSALRVHFKVCREVAFTLKGMGLKEAKKYLNQVLDHQRCVPYYRFTGGVGRNAQAKEFKGTTQGRWPKKACEFMLDLLRNAESNAEYKNLDTNALEITHIQVNQAQKNRRRTYRAHGRINPYQSSPSHIELFLEENEDGVKKVVDEEEAPKKKTVSKKKQARERAKQGLRMSD